MFERDLTILAAIWQILPLEVERTIIFFADFPSNSCLEVDFNIWPPGDPLFLIQGKPKEESDSLVDMTGNKNRKGSHQSLDMSKGVFKLPLVWINLEMTGLNVEVDRLLEIACVITDGKLRKLVEGPDLVIHQTKDCLDKMGEWCQDHHAANALTETVIQSTISEKEAEGQVVDFVKRHVGAYTPLLAGNSIHVDFMFLKKYMPDLAHLFSHVIVDVSSIKALCLRWFPGDKKAPRKEKKHRAMDVIKESIEELKYYKEHVFKSPKSKREC